MYINLNTHMSFEKFLNFNKKLNEHFNITTEEDSEVILKEYKSYLQNNKTDVIIIDPINSVLQNTV